MLTASGQAIPHTDAIQQAVAAALRAGTITYRRACEACGKSTKRGSGRATGMVLHHWSYAPEHWLDVITLCVGCHRRVHSGTIAEPRTGRVYSRRAASRPIIADKDDDMADDASSPSALLIRAAMTTAGLANDLELAAAVTRKLAPPLRLQPLTASRWMNGGGIPDALLPALCAALPSLRFDEVARALAESAAGRRGTVPTEGEW